MSKSHRSNPMLLALLTAVLSPLSALAAGSQDTGLAAVQALMDQGQYSRAQARISQLLERTQSGQSRTDLLFEAERMRRIQLDFTLHEKDLLSAIQGYIPDATAGDIAAWKRDQLLEYKVIDGERRYFRKVAYNLVHISDAAARRSNDYRLYSENPPLYALHRHHLEIINADTPVRRRFRVRYRLSVNPDAVPAGETIRAWIPFPKELPGRQENITLLQSSPKHHQLAPAQQPQRTIYFEQQAVAGEPTRFEVSYAFDSIAAYTRIDAEKVTPRDSLPQSVQPYLQEREPHIRFTPEMVALSKRIAGDEKNPYRIAQRLFAFVDAIPWAGAREYSTIRNISRYAAEAGHADCGQQTLLLITLMRLNGIPARWQSGWEFSPTAFDTMHDWGEFYLAPYGWMPMDVTHGKLGGGDSSADWFYLGGLDAYRLIFNSDYSRPLVPPKQHFRSETVDSQRGEVEWHGDNLYFDQWDYQLDWELLEQQ
ncbi:transglutaminase-like domain-containing protein [Microbulbifer sp. 2201CG32-9]|uniref:transglutaminase-like domain-containing protein n=1 Tax=Microbulbifer sp. 2201CG32-9 TaxID=3232309 RepID=UPI00345C098B